MPETTVNARERELREEAAKVVYSRIEADCERAPEIARFLVTIRENLFCYSFTVEELWRKHGVRDNNASAWFAPVGLPPRDYLADCRLRVAARLLATTLIKPHRVGQLVAYNCRSTFARAFKAWTGLTPKQFQKNPNREEAIEIDASKVELALKGRLSRPEGLALRRHLERRLRALYEPEVRELLQLADNALDTADYEGAQRLLEQAAMAPEQGYQTAIDGRLAVVTHCRGTVLTRKGDVDRAYEDLALARTCYEQAGTLEPSLAKRRRRLEAQLPCSTDQALTSALCSDCRRALVLPVGESLRGHLRRALELVPLDLEWFKVCCDDCYRVVWGAFKFARHGMLDDANKAWWLARHVDLEDSAAPPTMGCVIAALSEVDSFGWSSQEDRLKMCEVAFRAAEGVGRPELLAVTRFWKGNVLRSMACFTHARRELKWKWQGIENPWIRALHDRFLGILEQAGSNHSEALALLESAAAIYQTLDIHVAGLLIHQQGAVHLDSHDYAEAIQLFRQAVLFFDDRRDPHPTRAGGLVNLAMALAASGVLDEAQSELNRCHYDRKAYPATAATEAFTRGCVAVLANKTQGAVRLFSESQKLYQELGLIDNAALTAVHSAEAYYTLGDRDLAAIMLFDAGHFFEAVGCPQDTFEALAKIQALLAEGASKREVAVHARRLAFRHGSWLPPDNHLPLRD